MEAIKLETDVKEIKESLQKLKIVIMEMNQKLDILDTKYNETNEKLDGEVLQECKKMGSHIDFIENVYDNVKHPLGYICKKFNYLAPSSDETLTLENNTLE